MVSVNADENQKESYWLAHDASLKAIYNLQSASKTLRYNTNTTGKDHRLVERRTAYIVGSGSPPSKS